MEAVHVMREAMFGDDRLHAMRESIFQEESHQFRQQKRPRQEQQGQQQIFFTPPPVIVYAKRKDLQERKALCQRFGASSYVYSAEVLVVTLLDILLPDSTQLTEQEERAREPALSMRFRSSRVSPDAPSSGSSCVVC